MKVGMMNDTSLLESITLQIRATDPQRGWQRGFFQAFPGVPTFPRDEREEWRSVCVLEARGRVQANKEG